MFKIPLICSAGIGDSFLLLGRIPISLLGVAGVRFRIFYSSPGHPAKKILEPFFRRIRYCDYTEREPTAREKWIFSKMLSLSMRTTKIWRPPFEFPAIRKNKSFRRKILLHTHLDGHHGWKGATAKMWPIEKWVELCRNLQEDGWEISILEWDEFAAKQMFSNCPFVSDGKKKSLFDTVRSFENYDFLFSIDSWSKYVAVWFGVKQVVAFGNLQTGYVGFEDIHPNQVAKWWFHGLIENPNVEVLGLRRDGAQYKYTYDNILDLSVGEAFRAIKKVNGAR